MTGLAAGPAGLAGRRRAGLLLAVFGLVGLIVLGTALVFVARPVDADEGPFGIETQRRQLVTLLDTSRDAVTTAERAARNADGSLGSTAEAAGSAAGMMSELSSTMRRLGTSLRVTIFGTQPFAVAAADMDRVADQASTVAADLDVAAASVRDTSADMVRLADDLAEIRVGLERIRDSLADPIDAEGWRLLAIAILAWFAIPAAVSLVLGLRWLRRSGRPVPTPDHPASPRPGVLRDPD